MRLALFAFLGCWRPAPYTPPPPPEGGWPEARPEEAAEGAADAEPTGEAPGGAQPEGAQPEGAQPEGAQPEGAQPEAEEEEEEPERPPIDPYEVQTLQAPVSLVDDYGKLVVVIPTAPVTLEVREEDDIRARVWCASCSPPVEGWIQSHLIQRSSTGGSP